MKTYFEEDPFYCSHAHAITLTKNRLNERYTHNDTRTITKYTLATITCLLSDLPRSYARTMFVSHFVNP